MAAKRVIRAVVESAFRADMIRSPVELVQKRGCSVEILLIGPASHRQIDRALFGPQVNVQCGDDQVQAHFFFLPDAADLILIPAKYRNSLQDLLLEISLDDCGTVLTYEDLLELVNKKQSSLGIVLMDQLELVQSSVSA